MNKLTVIDFFCGAGGFSEGFRQQGFNIIRGIDSWEAATKTFNHNFDLNCSIQNILDFESSVEEIEKLPDTDIIIGSPPCVSFSNSNKSGKADKSYGVRLTEIFLRIVTVKKYKPNSILKAWFMENVENSIKYLKEYYTFKDLNLTEWARNNRIDENEKAIILKENQSIINSAKYGSPQIRKRAISGEIIKIGKMVIPKVTHKSIDEFGELPNYITLGQIKDSLPSPNSVKSETIICDPLYPEIKIKNHNLSDHFYDTGIYQCEWNQSKFLKTNHPYMGKMSFPENLHKPSRTVTATKISTSREAIIYKSEYTRIGDGEFRIPTIRESACLMGFPITYQFLGSEGVKHKLVGNAVCPSVSRAIAKQVRKELGLKEIKNLILNLDPNLDGVENLNSYQTKTFDNPPKRIKGSRFRRHPFKDGNITVTLSNYNIEKNDRIVSKWITSVQYGNGKGFPSFNFPNNFYKKMEPLMMHVEKGLEFLEIINNGFSEKIGDKVSLQNMYETQKSNGRFLEPTRLVEEVKLLINQLDVNQKVFEQKDQLVLKDKEVVPLKQIFALYAINKISSVANSK